MAETIGALIISTIAPNAIGIAGFSLASTTIAGVSLATVVGTAAILGVTIGLSYALKPGLPTPQEGSQAVKQAIPPRIRGYGTNRLAGYYMLFEAAGAGPNTSYDVMALHSGRIGRYLSFLLNDDEVHIDSDISLGGFGTVLGDYADGRYGGSRIQIETKMGTASQTALGSFTGDPLINGFWTSAHRGDGIAHVGMKCGAFAEVPDFTKAYPHQLPLLSVVADLSPVWDPRDPAQSRDDDSTWVVSHNPVIHMIDYITCEDGGMGEDYDVVIAPYLDQWMVEADLCDEQVDRAGGGTEPRYQCNGWYQYDNKPEDVIGGILATCDGWLAESGDGSLSITVGVYREPTDAPLTEKHIMGFALNYGQADEQMVNELDISFTDPASKYVQVQTDPWRDEDSISAIGETLTQPLDLKWVQSNSQARRLADRAMQRINPLMTGSFTTTLYGLNYLGKRWIPLQYPFVSGLQDCVVEVQNAEIDLMAGRIVWDFIRIAPDAIEAYDPDADEGETPVVPPPVPRRIGLDFSVTGNSQYIALLEDI